MQKLKSILPADLVLMDNPAYRVELAYAHTDNMLFSERIYRPDARLWLHKDLAPLVNMAAEYCLKTYNLRFILYDGLRTTDAQKRMLKTRRVQENPHWLEEPRLLSPPGTGGHPRGMAIDISLETLDGQLIDMGTPFDFLAENAEVDHNPAHRLYKGHTPEIIENRRKLDDSMEKAAQTLDIPLFPLPQEWWDFRLPSNIYNQYAPLAEADLPLNMRLLNLKP